MYIPHPVNKGQRLSSSLEFESNSKGSSSMMADPKNGTTAKFKQPPKSRSRAKPNSDSDKCKMIQQQLLLFMHAFDCQRRENGPDADKHKNCLVPFCKIMKDKLNHLSQCQDGTKCTFPDCAMSRQILDHWKDCTNKANCMVCSPLSPESSKTNTSSPQKNDAGTKVTAQVNQVWLNPIGKEQRDSLVILLVQGILSSSDRETISEEKMTTLNDFAKKVEATVYASSKSNQEYYHLLVEKVFQIQKCIEEKALKKKKQTKPLDEILQKLETLK